MTHRLPTHLTLLGALAVLAAVPAPTAAQDQEYVMFEVQFMTVRSGETAALNEAMAAHNRKYHAEGPYHASVWFVVNGPRTGQLVWTMGPVTFTQLDGRPAAGGHDDDWTENVAPHLEPQGDVSYWRRSDDLSYMPRGDAPPIIRVRYYDIADGQMARWNEQMALLKEVMEAKSYPYSTSVFRPRFRMQGQEDVGTVTAYDSWADLDQGQPLRADFIEVHGQGAWQRFLNTMSEVVVDSWDEYRQLMPELSGSGG